MLLQQVGLLLWLLVPASTDADVMMRAELRNGAATDVGLERQKLRSDLVLYPGLSARYIGVSTGATLRYSPRFFVPVQNSTREQALRHRITGRWQLNPVATVRLSTGASLSAGEVHITDVTVADGDGVEPSDGGDSAGTPSSEGPSSTLPAIRTLTYWRGRGSLGAAWRPDRRWQIDTVIDASVTRRPEDSDEDGVNYRDQTRAGWRLGAEYSLSERTTYGARASLSGRRFGSDTPYASSGILVLGRWQAGHQHELGWQLGATMVRGGLSATDRWRGLPEGSGRWKGRWRPSRTLSLGATTRLGVSPYFDPVTGTLESRVRAGGRLSMRVSKRLATSGGAEWLVPVGGSSDRELLVLRARGTYVLHDNASAYVGLQAVDRPGRRDWFIRVGVSMGMGLWG